MSSECMNTADAFNEENVGMPDSVARDALPILASIASFVARESSGL